MRQLERETAPALQQRSDTEKLKITVEALVSDHPRELKKVVATRTGRLREFDREIAQCRKNYERITSTQFLN